MTEKEHARRFANKFVARFCESGVEYEKLTEMSEWIAEKMSQDLEEYPRVQRWD